MVLKQIAGPQVRAAVASSCTPKYEIALVLAPGVLQVRVESCDGHGRQWDRPVRVPLARAHGDLVAREIEVLGAEEMRLEEAKATAVEQDGDETLGAA